MRTRPPRRASQLGRRYGSLVQDGRGHLVATPTSYVFRHGRTVLPTLAEVTLDVAAGEFVSIVGPSGCGKSTFLNVLAGLVSPDSGRILIDDQDVTGITGGAAYHPQRDVLLPWRRVIDNVTLGLEVQGLSRTSARGRVVDLFEPFGLHGFERSYPFQLSGGMRQRAALLRTVVQNRPVLLLDEPFAALDALTRSEVQEWLADLWQRYRWTVVLVTHDIREAVYLSDRVIVFSPRPARVSAEIRIDQPRPRRADTQQGRSFEAMVHAALRRGNRA